MSDEEEEMEPTPQAEPDLEIHRIDPDGLHLYNVKPRVEDVKKVDVPEVKNVMDDDVSTFSTLWLGFKQLMVTTILLTKAREAMATTDATAPAPTTLTVETKKWYESKTLWLNGLTFAWYFVGPMVGIPILSPEITGIALTAANILLRAITKQPVTIS